MPNVLLIEDDVVIQELVVFNLEREGYTVMVAEDGKKGLEIVHSEQPDLILLDLMLPLLDGYEVCKAIRADKEISHLPILMLSARDHVVDKVIGLELGADDYVTKPFSPRELLARIKARLREESRKPATDQPKSLSWGDLEIWADSYRVTIKGENITLTAKEFELLHTFLMSPNQVFSREFLLQKVWGYQKNADTRTVDVHISYLRNKIKGMGPIIGSVRGIGYRFSNPNKN